MEFDVIIVGAGPAGLSAAIKLKQLANDAQQNLSVCVLEKASEVGAHSLSGAVLEPRALNELFPNWQQLGAPLTTAVSEDRFVFLTEKKSFKLPTPPSMKNHGNYIISLGEFCRWLAQQAQALGVEIYPGFPAAELIVDEHGKTCGVITGDMGVDAQGNHKESYQPGMALYAKQTLLAEGCRGSLTKQAEQKYQLRQNPQTYGIGIKEIWEVDNKLHQPGLVIHSIGWPLTQDIYGGSFIYHLDNKKIAVGFVVGLDYKNTYLSPFEEFQRFKLHPSIRPFFSNGRRISYGSRALNEGGLQGIPKLTFPGGMLIGCSAGFLNVPKIKGNHTAMKSGMLAAQTIFSALSQGDIDCELKQYEQAIKDSWVYEELFLARNIRPGFHKGLWAGLAYAAFDQYILRGKAPWTFKLKADHAQLLPANKCQKIAYPKPDNKITFDRLSSVFLSNTNHEENQPVHLQLKNPDLAININYKKYDSPETRYCPAAVYEIVENDGQQRLQINSQNCVHCKTCDIKDPLQNINWVPPEGGGGPNYENM